MDDKARMQFIVERMLAGRWGAHDANVASLKWEISPSAIRALVDDATRAVRELRSEGEAEVRAQLVAGIEAVRGLCLTRTRAVVTKDGEVLNVPDPDLRTALESYDRQAKMMQLDQMKGDGSALGGRMAPDEVKAFLARWLEDLERK